jgi:CheY-like chemotaxis protein
VLVRQFLRWGMLARETASPAEAIAWLQGGETFDVAVLDMQMKDMDGGILSAELRREPSGKDLPIIICTSLGRHEGSLDGIGAAAVLTKPIRASQLYDSLVSLFAEVPVGGEEPDTRRTQRMDPETGKRFPLRVLLAEDNATNQKIALRLLSQLGYIADVAGNGIEVIQALERQPYDLVFMDVQMPDLDGIEASREICRRWAKGKRPRIVAMTADAMEGDRERCLDAGMDDYLCKPIRVTELLEKVGECWRAAHETGRTDGE